MPAPCIIVHGGIPLSGAFRVHRSKNAILSIMAASLLIEGKVRIRNVPHIADVEWMARVLQRSGAEVVREEADLVIIPEKPPEQPLSYSVTRKLRASILVLGPLLGRWGKVQMHRPGGCAIGVRPIHFHLQGMQRLGAQVEEKHGLIDAYTNGRLKGNSILLDYPSVGATENLLMASVLSDGVTEISNSAQEPEVIDLCQFLVAAGGRIEGIGTGVLRVTGVERLHGVDYQPIADRIEAGTYLAAAAITGGQISLDQVQPAHLIPVLQKFREMGCEISVENQRIHFKAPARLKPVHIQTQPYPGFPTDLQPVFMACCTVADGVSIITETVFERRFSHVDELCRMGARIFVKKDTSTIEGVEMLTGAVVEAMDIRGGASLLVAALAASNYSEIRKAHHILRGYEDPVRCFRSLGANIRWSASERKK